MKYTTKPVAVEAYQVRHPEDTDTHETAIWVLQAVINGSIVAREDGSFVFPRAGGGEPGAAHVGDYVILGPSGPFPCPKATFERDHLRWDDGPVAALIEISKIKDGVRIIATKALEKVGA